MAERPNFLIFMTEQHRGDCLSADGHPVLLTPNMDSIGMGGARFTHGYTTCPTCIAARRSFLSGQYPSTHGMIGYHDGVEWDAPTTVAGALGEAGYQTEWIGRSMHQHPVRKRYGFDHMVAHAEYEDFLRQNQPPGRAPLAEGRFGAGPMHNDWTARPYHLDEYLHSTNWITNQALTFLDRRDPSSPFFAVVSYYAAHPPLTPPGFYMERYLRSDIPEPVIGDWATPPDENWHRSGAGGTRVDLQGEELQACRAGYYGLINHVDDQIRRILSPVSGVQRMTNNNTVVMFVSDHGEMLGDHYHFHKRLPYESSAHIPFMISAPRRYGIEEGTVLDNAVSLEDVMPTVLDLANVEAPETVEGKSLVALMRGDGDLSRSYLHIEHAPLYQSLTDGKEKYIWFTQDGRDQFFDLKEDPEECHNLIDSPDYAERVEFWRDRLIEELEGRPEEFSDGEKLIPGRPHNALMPS
ncbi:MAG: arylsulfatase [Candidatus Brocadiia bacterium]